MTFFRPLSLALSLSAFTLLAACGGEPASSDNGASNVKAEASKRISGAGATFPYPIYAKWAAAYKEETGATLNYQSIGSGGGIKQIKARTVTFGASDAPLSIEELDEAGLVQFPMVMGGVVPVINVEGIQPGELTLDGVTLARMFMGQIRKWNDPALLALNPDLILPDQAIAIVHRSDGSGTTYNFTYYLASVSEAWKNDVGVAKSVQWPVGIGGKGNEGVANGVMQTAGAIGYVEYAYAKQNNIADARMINRDGVAVAAGISSFMAAAANADWKSAPGFQLILANQPGADSWPMTAATFILVHAEPEKPADVRAALDFFAWSYTHGGAMAEELQYVPMPASVVGLVKQTWAGIKGANGQPIWP